MCLSQFLYPLNIPGVDNVYPVTIRHMDMVTPGPEITETNTEWSHNVINVINHNADKLVIDIVQGPFVRC